MTQKLLGLYDSYYNTLPTPTRVNGEIKEGRCNFHSYGLVDEKNNYGYFVDNKFECQVFWFPDEMIPQFEAAVGYKISAVRGTYMPPNSCFMAHMDNHPNARGALHTYILNGDGEFKLFIGQHGELRPILCYFGPGYFVFEPSAVFHDYSTNSQGVKIVSIQTEDAYSV